MKIGQLRAPRWLMAIFASLCLVLTACTASLPDNLDNAVSDLPGQIQTLRGNVDKAEAAYGKKLRESKYSFMQDYTREQRHADRFDQARTKLNEADRAYNGTVKPIVDNYEDTRQGALKAAIKSVDRLKGKAQRLIDDPTQWADKVVATRANPTGTVKTAADQLQNIKIVYDPLVGDVEAVKKVYERTATTIDAKFQPISNLHADALQANGLLQAEAAKTKPNYAVMTEQAIIVENRAKSFQKDAPEFKGKLARLDIRESHTLIDLRQDSTVVISRTSWDDAYSSPDEHDYDYPAMSVDLKTADYFAQFGPDDVLAIDDGSSFATDRADEGQWKKLHIEPRKGWHDGDTDAEFYVGEIERTYCHKLRVLKDGKPDASGRPAAKDNSCDQHNTSGELVQGIYWIETDDIDAEAIGMDVYSKGFGDLEPTEEASPPGMVYVGDPEYGAWQTDNANNRFWAYYGQYMFFSRLIGGPNSYHYWNEWDEWNRGYRYHGKPYYSSYRGKPRYGLSSPYVVSRFPRSVYVKSGLQSATVRNAGPAARADGPGNGK